MLQGKVALVTGAASGIGLAIAKGFHDAGAHVVLVDVNSQQLEDASKEFNTDKVSTFQCDVSSESDVASVCAAIESQIGRLDALVNNAGIASIGSLENTSLSELERVFSVNVNGLFLFSKHAMPLLEKAQGAILNLSSIAAKVGISDRFAYSASKGAVLAMTLSIARDYVAKGVRCNCLCPARVYTPFVDGYLEKHYPDTKEEMFKTLSEYQPIGRMGTPKEIADLTVFLCSDKARFITGSAYDIDGGVTQLR
ncbi:putative 3-OXOACYL-(ACYL CARRIER PROTEIN) REDUCTASE [Vibrio nigripulchritudo MADA3029]|uniref:SDR family NAD(P)-dependent oxidoreductase n=1 Tax=Vibrio nigripulchritudo TaxID=28173 RepID=UPI0003B18EF3|nr:SDR family oxidoreductase [Vibrio nigripulchritudo]CCN49258.1 putative 3-OXOACYL-(ACYL CARRIER PROTEIN) REDUCTASE [Vibrio nigripulchritudo MADA3020]CCN54242.1 putative 3-OXOACYL-(ACYL CARRIER PROTEIN) REDUCTASE [Vibrio nigripulchritudo MADA3021]CCN61313.1 putative 3-OXOACYL-(ACYL CARRIER PROTEIN) REDUCTASE [Vibrio nigripulchritudo MADA3029]